MGKACSTFHAKEAVKYVQLNNSYLQRVGLEHIYTYIYNIHDIKQNVKTNEKIGNMQTPRLIYDLIEYSQDEKDENQWHLHKLVVHFVYFD